ncbi:MAG: hypothetical protein Q8M71_07590 [Thermodesulfovibrionales bacterium]|nr:hypothetical protein [Thermodesulfovibrionales bacterium]
MADVEKLYDRYHESRQKFDYFITGLATTVLAYSVQSFDSGKYANYIWLAPIAWSFLLIAVIAGLVRLEWIIAVLGIETEKFTKQTIYQNIYQNIPDSLRNAYKLQEQKWKGLPEELTPEGMEKWINKSLSDCSKSIEFLNAQQSKAIKIVEWAYRFREWSLIIGLFFLGVLKIVNF